jgi:hypothetical protein
VDRPVESRPGGEGGSPVSCHVCQASLGCAVDCPNAPWNWDEKNGDALLPKTTKKGYLKRLVRWVRSVCPPPRGQLPFPPLGFTLSDLRWMR